MKRAVVVAVAGVLCLALLGGPVGGQGGQPAKPDPSLLKVYELFHGTWERPASKDIPWKTEATYDWEFNKTAVRGLAVMGKGTPEEFRDSTDPRVRAFLERDFDSSSFAA